MKTILIALTILVSACATAAVRYVTINYTVLDQPESRSLKLVYSNDQAKNVCIDSSNWPTPNGIIDNSGTEFYVEVDGNRHLLKRQQDYCPGCGVNVKPGQSVEATLKYEAFDLPDSLYSKPKSLHLKSVGFFCRSAR